MARPKKTHVQAPADTAIIFTRVSSKEQREEGFSLDAQLDYLRQYCVRTKLRVVAEIVIDESAKNPQDRKKFEGMLAHVRKESIRNIVVEKTDRIYRMPHDWVKIEALKVDLHLVKQGAIINEKSTSHEKFVHGLHVLMARHYVDNLSEETKKGMERKAKDGLWPSAAPLGYVNVLRDSRRFIDPDPEVAPIVATLFNLYASGDASLKTAGASAAVLGLTTRSGKKLTASHVHIILKNPIYKGVVRWNGQEYPGVHEPIVSVDVWEKVQSVMEGRNGSEGGGYAKPEFAYRGLVTCGVCGCAASPYIKKGQYIYYACTGARGCRRNGVREEAITELVSKALESLSIRRSVLDLLKDAIREGHADLLVKQGDAVERLESRRKEMAGKIEQLYLDKVSGVVPESAYPRIKERWEKELATIENEIRAHGPAHRATWDQSLALLEAVSNSSHRFKEAKPEARRRLFKTVVSNCKIVDGKVELELRPEFKSVVEANRHLGLNPALEADLENWLGILEGMRTLCPA